MRLLWIGKASDNPEAGEEVYDRKILQQLRAQGVEIEHFSPLPVPRIQEVGNLLRGAPYYRARYASRANRAALIAASRRHNVAIASWEPFDQLALGLDCPVIPVLHNVTSWSLPALFPGRLLARAAGAMAGRYENSVYGKGFPKIAVLARADAEHVGQKARPDALLYVPPGLPHPAPLAEDATFAPRLILSGTYDWYPKHRDLLAFARELAPIREHFDIVADSMPADAAALLSPRRPVPDEHVRSIGIGIVPDRFAAGYKLKSGAYIAGNAIVASFADVMPDFADLPDAGFFIRRINHAGELIGIAAELAAQPPAALRARLMAFKSACADRFSWARSARRLCEAAAAVAR